MGRDASPGCAMGWSDQAGRCSPLHRARDPRVPWHVKSRQRPSPPMRSPHRPLPDFIPVLGYLDELILLPIAVALVIRMIPGPLMAEFRAEARRRSERPVSRMAAAVIIGLWMLRQLPAVGVLADPGSIKDMRDPEGRLMHARFLRGSFSRGARPPNDPGGRETGWLPLPHKHNGGPYE